MPRRKQDPGQRRASLVDAAAKVFARKGVVASTVSDIVSEAGVAQGTFYLYFRSKDEALIAVVDRVTDDLASAISATLDVDADAVTRFGILVGALTAFEGDRTTEELADLLHRPENRALHDRLEERLAPRLVDHIERIVAAGVEEGIFDVRDIREAAWFVLGGLQSIEASGTAVADMPRAVESAGAMALRALGYQGE